MAKARKTRRSIDWEDLILDALFAPWDWLKEGFAAAAQALKRDPKARWVALLFALALLFRLWRPDWYRNAQFHPDERWLFGTTAVLHYPDLPGEATRDGAGLQYGSLPLYALAAAKDAASLLPKAPAPHDFVKAGGRTLTGIVDAVSVLLLYLLGAALFSPAVGLMAAALLCFTTLNIQLAHFFTVDPWMACFSLAALIAAAKAARTRALKWSMASGLAYAAALASKSAALPLALPILLAHAWPCLDPGLKDAERRGRMKEMGLGLGAAALSALIAFFIFMPLIRPLDPARTAENFRKFFRNQAEQRNILVTGSPEGTPFVRQYWDTGILFHVKNLVFYYQGILLGVLGWVAALWFAVLPALRLWKGRPGALQRLFAPALILSWLLPYFLIVGAFSFAKFARYMLPLTPLLALLAAAFLEELRGRFPRAGRALAWAALIGTAGYGLGYVGTYSRPHPWIEASTWMLEGNVPPMTRDLSTGQLRRTRVYNETWGDDLPVDVPGKGNAGSYDNRKINIVEWDSPRKLQEFGQALADADILVMADARAYGTYLRLPTRFPLTHAYFDLMMRSPDRLGFELAHQSSNRMRWMGAVEVDDSRLPSVPTSLWADESFTLYDRPHAFLFRKLRAVTPQEVMDALQARVKELGLPEAWRKGHSPEDNRRAAQGLAPEFTAGLGATSTIPARVNPNLGTSRGRMLPLGLPVLTWWILASAMGLLALPLCLAVFRNFPDGGWALARALGIFLFSWLAYNLAWLRALPFHQWALWLLLGLLGLGAWLWARPRMAQLKAWVLEHRSEILWSEAIFAGAFLFFCLARSFNPNIHDIAGHGYFGGGEPLGMTYLSAVTRCSTFPAYDPWLALHDSSYYYFGYVMAGALTKLSGFAPSVTYNLSLALYFALAVASAYGVGRALSGRRVFALAGAAAVALFGSLWSVGYMAMQAGRGGSFQPFEALRALFSHSFIWDPTRFPELANFYIFEFPYFSYLYGDLHPHNMVVPFGLLLTGLLLAPFKSALGGWRAFGPSWPVALLWACLAGLLVDAQYAINTWNWPVFLALSAGAMTVGPWAGKKLGLGQGLLAAATGALAWALAALLGFGLMTGFRAYFLQQGGNRLGQVHPSEWQLSAYIPMAFFLFGLAGLAVLAGLRLRAFLNHHAKALNLKRLARQGLLDAAPTLLERLWARMPLTAVLAGLGLAASAVFLFMSLPGLSKGSVLALSLGLGILFVTLFCLRGHEEGGEAFLWMAGAFSMFLVAGSEIYFVADRMNTIFKFWFNAWILLGLAFGAGFGRWFEAYQAAKAKAAKPRAAARQRLKERLRLGLLAAGLVALCFATAILDAPRGRPGGYALSQAAFVVLLLLPAALMAFHGEWAGAAGKGLFFALLFMGLLYPLGATVARISEASGFRNPRLDGMAFMAERTERSAAADNQDYDKWDYDAILWLNKNAELTEVLLEAPGVEMYRGLNRYAIYTGLPTLLGWKYQVGQQLGARAGGQLEERQRDAMAIYTSTQVEEAKALLHKYKVRWIVVGNIERKVAGLPHWGGLPSGRAGLEKFASFCKEAYRNQGVTLYRFDG